MTDLKPVQAQVTTPKTLLAMEIWGDVSAVETRLGAALPAPGTASEHNGRRFLWWEPDTWLVRAPSADRDAAIDVLMRAVDAEGAITDLSGGFTRHRLDGAGWRELLMIGGVFDAESPKFGVSSVVGTVIHHMPVRLDVISEASVEVYVPPSYSDDLLHHWAQAISRRASV